MHVATDFFPDTPLLSGWALAITGLIAVIAIFTCIQLLDKDGNIAKRVAKVSLTVAIVAAVAGMGILTYDGSTSVDKTATALQAQAKRTYGLQLTSEQAHLLVKPKTDFWGQRTGDPGELGSTSVQHGATLQEVTLFNLGDKFFLYLPVKNGSHTELPRAT